MTGEPLVLGAILLFVERVPPKYRSIYVRDAWAGMLGSVMLGVAIPFFANIARHTLKASEVEVGLVVAAPVAGFILAFIWANLMEGKRKMPFAFSAWLIARLLLCAAIFVHTAREFVALVIVFWLISSMASPAYTAIMKEVYPDTDRGRIMGYVRVWSSLVLAIATLIAGKLLESVGYRYVFPVAGLFGVVSAFVFRSIPTYETTGDRSQPIKNYAVNSLKILHVDKGYRWFCAGIFLSGSAIFFATPVYTIYQVDILGVGQSWTAIYSFINLALSMIGYYYWSTKVDKRSPSSLIAICNLMFVVVPLIYLFANQRWILIPSMVLTGIGNAGCDLAYFNGIMMYAPRERVAQYQAVFSFLMGIRGIAAPYLGAKLVAMHCLSMNQVFVISAVITLASVFVLRIGDSKYKSLAKASYTPQPEYAKSVKD